MREKLNKIIPQLKPTANAPVLRLDGRGREIDEQGNVVNVTKPSNLATLKVNINKQKKEAFEILKPVLDFDPESNPHFDPRIGIDKTKLLWPKRTGIEFVAEGKKVVEGCGNHEAEEYIRRSFCERALPQGKRFLHDPNTMETIVSLYMIIDLLHPHARGRVKDNANEYHLTGCAVIRDGVSVVVVEGGSKSIKEYGKVMLKRIGWNDFSKEKEEIEDSDNDDNPVNKCVLAWQGSVAKPSFSEFSVHDCITEAAARKVFTDAGVPHYWDHAVSIVQDEAV
ncbi:hypothetical protein RIF29_16751 [Crotalaria pallida]|uniref:Small nuclear ribonucleoprotein Prp3 C-terminal domain-containing protein n=1 Tax=Crotalaria pallida TaxID=3830 RepID=A0AAN9FHX7_CROPI